MSNQQPEQQPIKGALSYSCTFYSHQFCDGELEAQVRPDNNPGPVPCGCPCHQRDVVLK